MSTWDRAAVDVVWYDPHTQWQSRKLEVLNLLTSLPLKVSSCQGRRPERHLSVGVEVKPTYQRPRIGIGPAL